MKKILLFVMAVLMITSAFAGCNQNTATATPDSVTGTETPKFYSSGKETFEIETEYGTLVYPKKWEDSCVTEIKTGDPYIVSFLAVVKDEKVPVFDVAFGTKPEESFQVGILSTDKGDVDVYIVDHSGKFTKKYPQTGYPELYEMSEDMNEVISGLISRYKMTVV